MRVCGAPPGVESIEGTRFTTTVKVIVHFAALPPTFAGPSTTVALGMNSISPVVALAGPSVHVFAAQAVPATDSGFEIVKIGGG
jgi:hypothetical protein